MRKDMSVQEMKEDLKIQHRILHQKADNMYNEAMRILELEGDVDEEFIVNGLARMDKIMDKYITDIRDFNKHSRDLYKKIGNKD